MKVSIIVPVYNAALFLEETMESLLNQTYKDIEYIFVDDGSKDNSVEILKKWKEKDERIQLLFQENAGAPAARNNGFQNATGTYVMFFDADDILRKDAIEKMMSAAVKNQADLVIGLKKYDLNSSEEDLKQMYTLDDKVVVYKNRIPEAIFDEDPLPGNKLYRTDFLKENEIYFDKLKLGQDLNLYIKAIFRAKVVCKINTVVMDYRIVAGSISRVIEVNRIINIKNSLDYAEAYVCKERSEKEYKKILDSLRIVNYQVQAEKIKVLTGAFNRLYCCWFFFWNSRSFLWSKKKFISTPTVDMRRKKLIKYFICSPYLVLMGGKK